MAPSPLRILPARHPRGRGCPQPPAPPVPAAGSNVPTPGLWPFDGASSGCEELVWGQEISVLGEGALEEGVDRLGQVRLLQGDVATGLVAHDRVDVRVGVRALGRVRDAL